MKVKIGNMEYNVISIPPSLAPYSTYISELLKVTPKTFEEAEKNSVEIEKAMIKLFEGTVSPQPKREHHIQLYNAVIEETNKALEQAGFFRKPRKSDVEKSGADEPINP